MKTIIKYILAATVILSVSSCKKFLDKEPIAQVTPDNFITNEQNAKAAVSGMYRTMLSAYSYGQSTVIIPEFSAQHVNHASSYPEFVEFSQNKIRVDNPWTMNIWNATYATINAANNIIKRVAEIPANAINGEKRQQFILEAKFVRALSYFTLVRAFGAVPLLVVPTAEDSDLRPSRTPAEQVYTQIITDLTEAATLPNGYANTAETKGQATGFAAKALLSKVNLYHANITNNYSESARLANEVITTGGFILPDDFSSVWTDENTTESIFELQFDAQATNTLASVSNPSPSMLFYARDASIADLYETTDVRKNFTIYQGTAPDVRYYIGKYRQFSPPVQNFPVIRLAEILLIHAEAKARLDGNVSEAAYSSYKKVRDRANLTTAARSSFTSVAQFVTAVQKEKRLELMFEGEAWFDYCRTGLALTEMMSIANTDYYLYPIPASERLVNTNLSQNKGY
ncbi:RagB/SusD family nutrient uptake outer membrane protein [Pedobacter sp. MC2016-14]|uniref:RagB/SusD family nutrient uptake outer membrane protein n=1 Tax=Pedobacter sp. MC2016-14 TaxID=2897327 RepID=UPI001E61CC35|nr:RagB/SusD family nutrient uptake outer membrane protein [Pedobacter sp. MC2016-14]MCD0487406.1 RagB/SusD family nutrient uptake outer membrane protein [Pedobacter sp. MC2016-14]